MLLESSRKMNINQITKQDWVVLDSDYSHVVVDRTSASRYKPVQRGSIRLVRDLYRTEAEQSQFIDAGLQIRLPGQRI